MGKVKQKKVSEIFQIEERSVIDQKLGAQLTRNMIPNRSKTMVFFQSKKGVLNQQGSGGQRTAADKANEREKKKDCRHGGRIVV